MCSLVRPNGCERVHLAGSAAEFVELQVNYLLIAGLAVTSTATVAAMWLSHPQLALSILLVGQLTGLTCFCTLSIRVREGVLLWQFGPGWIKGRVRLRDVTHARVVWRRRHYGWGLCRRAGQWRWHFGEGMVLEIIHSKNRRLRLSTTRGRELKRLLDAARLGQAPYE